MIFWKGNSTWSDIKTGTHSCLAETTTLLQVSTAQPVCVCAGEHMYNHRERERERPQSTTHNIGETKMTPHAGQGRTWHFEGVQNTLSFPVCQGHWTLTLEIPAVYNINMHTLYLLKEHKNWKHS